MNKLLRSDGRIVDISTPESMRSYAIAKCSPKRLDQMVARFMRASGYSDYGRSK